MKMLRCFATTFHFPHKFKKCEVRFFSPIPHDDKEEATWIMQYFDIIAKAWTIAENYSMSLAYSWVQLSLRTAGRRFLSCLP